MACRLNSVQESLYGMIDGTFQMLHQEELGWQARTEEAEKQKVHLKAVFHVLSRLLALRFGSQQLLGSAWGRWHRAIRDSMITELEYKLEEKSLHTNETKKQLVSAVHSSVQSVNQLSEALAMRDAEISRLEKELENHISLESPDAVHKEKLMVAQRMPRE